MHYHNSLLSIDVYDDFINDLEEIKKSIEAQFGPTKMTKKGLPFKRRQKLIFGDDDFPKYTIEYRGKIIETPVLKWQKLPVLQNIRDKISEFTKQPFNTCVIQLYNNGETGIKPHRDKEVNAGTIIASISIGETRIMRFERSSKSNIDIPLHSGSLCLINPPTNDYWMHSIPTDETKGKRISLVFRYFK